MPAFPPYMRPRRQLSIVFMKGGLIKGFDAVREFYASAPPATFERLSKSAGIKARVRLVRKPDDDNFELLEVLEVPQALRARK